MYEYIKGKYIGINKDYVIIENNGIGYKIFTSGATMAEMPKIAEEVQLYLEQIVREDFIGLYGFKDREELEKNPVIDMRSDGTHNQPKGTWSDDTSMTLCLVDNLIKGYDLNEIANNFVS